MPIDPNIYSQLNTGSVAGGLADTLNEYSDRKNRLSQLAQQQELTGQQIRAGQRAEAAIPQQMADAAAAKKEKHMQELSAALAFGIQQKNGYSNQQLMDSTYQEAMRRGLNDQDVARLFQPWASVSNQTDGVVVEPTAQEQQGVADVYANKANPQEGIKQRLEAMNKVVKPDASVHTLEVGVEGRPDYRQKQQLTKEGWANVGPAYQIGQGVTVNANNAKTSSDERFDMGLPKPVNLPWAGIKDSKAKASLQNRVYQAASKSLEATEKNVSRLEESAQDAQRFMELNKSVETGTLIDKMPGGQWAASFGDANSEMQKITAKVAPNMRPEGSGATSDFDAKQFERATLSVNAPKGANDAVGAVVLAKAKNERDYYDFKKSYLEQNGTLEGAQRHWDVYQKNNAVFDKTKPGTLTLNKNRIDWRDYFANQGNQSQVPNDRRAGDKQSGKTIVKTGTANGRKVIQYSDGSIDYAD